jgi:PPK2 family polyphosphate:nucleotide phosphotransferase
MVNKLKQLIEALRVPPNKKVNLRKDYDPGFVGHFMSKADAEKTTTAGINLLAEQQDKLYAQDTYALLIILQGMDAAGKDSTIKHVMSGVNPQGVRVTSFKEPSLEELNHDYLWRNVTALPKRGEIAIFNRSYYEEVLVVRVHPEYLKKQHLPPKLKDTTIWNRRLEEINNFEKYLVNNGIIVLKCFLNVSTEVQKKRFLNRVDLADKNWKFSASDIQERQYWDQYMDAYQDVINTTSTPWAPWYIIPADHKWFTRLAVVSVIHQTLNRLNLSYPTVSRDQRQALLDAKAEMEREGGGVKDTTEKKKGKKKNVI